MKVVNSVIELIGDTPLIRLSNLAKQNWGDIYLKLEYFNRALNKIIKENKLPNITIHGFRHTHCSLLFEAGVSVKEVQDRLGHSSAQTTMNIYNHVMQSKKTETGNKFASFMNF